MSSIHYMMRLKHQFNKRQGRKMARTAEKPDLPAAARRALAEAEERRKQAAEPAKAREIGGRDGPEPTRFGDWERKGIASDF